VFGHAVVPNNPAGSCTLRMLRGLCEKHEFTVFAVEFENPRPDRIRFRRIPAPMRPLVLLFLGYNCLAFFYYFVYLWKTKTKFDFRQTADCNFILGDITYAHFCHRTYLRLHWRTARPSGLRRWLHWLDHTLHALVEPIAYHRARTIVAASNGLARELAFEYPECAHKIVVIPIGIEIERMRRPEDFDRETVRRCLHLDQGSIALVFVALGAFERKGLPQLLEALTLFKNSPMHLLVVGGPRDLIESYQKRVAKLGLRSQVIFVGKQPDIRPYLWASDVFIFPSLYEVFPAVALEAAAAGLPIIATAVNGVEDFLADGTSGIVISPAASSIADGLSRFVALTRGGRVAMGAGAQKAVEAYGIDKFVISWECFYQEPV
jgi:glycosyltransferase involved in cell wall biosynthesis